MGLTEEGYEDILLHQEGVCAICKREPQERMLCVDHDHESGEIRGLLCNACNFILGLAKDSPFVLEGAARYLRKY
jgi:hypothetical protein